MPLKSWLHPSEGEWRAYLDGEVSESTRQALDLHLGRCVKCRHRFAEVQGVAALAAARLGALKAVAEVAPIPLLKSTVAPGTRKEVYPMPAPRFRLRWAVAAAAAILVGSMFAPSLRAMAAEWLTVFRVQDARVVRINPGDFKQVGNAPAIGTQALGQFVQIERVREPKTQRDLTLTQVQSMGFKTPAYLPAGYAATGANGYHVTASEQYVQVDVDGVNDLLALAGSKARLPMDLKGQTIRVQTGQAAVFTYMSGEKHLTVMQGQPPVLSTSGKLDPKEAISALVSALGTEFGLPTSLTAQLEGLDLTRTIPLPLVEGKGAEIKVKGNTGTYYEQQGIGVVVWVADGDLHTVGGPLSQAELIKIAASIGG